MKIYIFKRNLNFKPLLINTYIIRKNFYFEVFRNYYIPAYFIILYIYIYVILVTIR